MESIDPPRLHFAVERAWPSPTNYARITFRRDASSTSKEDTRHFLVTPLAAGYERLTRIPFH